MESWAFGHANLYHTRPRGLSARVNGWIECILLIYYWSFQKKFGD
jgi:hypothetical protein